MARPKQPLLTRRAIAEAAIEMLDAGHELQVVPLARRLGVSVSSLYHHVDGRQGIIHAMREVLSERYQLVPSGGAAWDDVVRSAVASLWHLYGEHPRALQLLLTVVIDEPATVGFYGEMVEALRAAGIPEDELLSTVETLDAFAFGVALDALSPDRIFDPGDAAPSMEPLIERHPVGAVRNALLFERGLELIIAGIRVRGETARGARGASS